MRIKTYNIGIINFINIKCKVNYSKKNPLNNNYYNII